MKKAATVLRLLAVLLLALYSTTVLQAQGSSSSQPHVVLIGIDNYKDAKILKREHAEADAKALYDLCINKAHLDVDKSNIKLLLGSEDKERNSLPATRENILEALKWAVSKAKRNDLVIIGMFGNGGPIGESTCFFAADSTYKDRMKTAVDSSELEQILKKLESHRVIVLLDINFRGFDPGKEQIADPNPAAFYRAFMDKDEPEEEISRAVFLANTGLKPSLNLGKHGVFTEVLLSGLSGKADTAGYGPDGRITVEELAKYVREELPNLVKKHGKTAEEKDQTPIVLEGQSHNFVIDRNPAVMPIVQNRLEAFAKLAKEKNLPEAIREEGTIRLSRMPQLEAKQELRKLYEQFADNKLSLEEFQKRRDKILEDTQVAPGNLAYFATMVIKASEEVEKEYVREVNQGELVEWAVRGLFNDLDEVVPPSLESKLANSKTMRESDMRKVLIQARSYLGKEEDLAKGKDITIALQSMLGKLDRHTGYIDPETLTRMLIDIQGDFSGIGVQIRRNSDKDALQVVTPLIGSPAYKAGMYTGDLIRTIIREVDGNGDPLPQPETISTKGMSTEDAVKKILGKPGTKVKLIVEREGVKDPLEFELIRGQVELESVLGYKRKDNDQWDYVIDPENKICYVRLTQFSRHTQRDLSKVMQELYKVGIKGFILDLRFNPGGLLDSAVKISDMFMDDGMIVTVRPRNGVETSYVGQRDGSYLTFPMVCLINGYSASGSEIVAACLQDHGRAIIIGSRSYGKGSVQTIHDFATGGKLKLTTASFWRPIGTNLNKPSTKGSEEEDWGVKPDKGYNLKLTAKELGQLQEFMRFNEIIHKPGTDLSKEEILKFEDRQLQMALDYLRGQIRVAAKATEKRGPGVVRN